MVHLKIQNSVFSTNKDISFHFVDFIGPKISKELVPAFACRQFPSQASSLFLLVMEDLKIPLKISYIRSFSMAIGWSCCTEDNKLVIFLLPKLKSNLLSQHESAAEEISFVLSVGNTGLPRK